MLYVLAAFVAAVAGVLLKGLLHLSLGEILISLAVPVMLLYKLFGNRPSFFVYAGMIAGFLGGFAALWAYVVVPIQYYYQIWGWLGIVGGIVAVLLLPAQLILFLVVAFLKGGAAVYLANFFAGICFGLAGLLLFSSAFSMPIWSYFLRKKRSEAI
jgi:hypothetical protein